LVRIQKTKKKVFTSDLKIENAKYDTGSNAALCSQSVGAQTSLLRLCLDGDDRKPLVQAIVPIDRIVGTQSWMKSIPPHVLRLLPLCVAPMIPSRYELVVDESVRQVGRREVDVAASHH